MTRVERNNKLKHFIACLKCEVSGKCCDDNCPTQYDAGNMGEIIENLEAISKALEQEPCDDVISRGCNNCAYYVNGANDEACDGCFADEYEHPNFKPKAQPCDNCISRQAMQIELKKCEVIDVYDENDNLVGYYNADTVDSIVRNLPPVKPQEVGYWIDADGDNAICSCCNRLNHLYGTYCKHCGAKMIKP